MKRRPKLKPKTSGTSKGRAWRDAAKYSVEDLKTNRRHSCIYGGKAGLDAAAAIALLDAELARVRIVYTAKYLGVRDGRATFRIESALTLRNSGMSDAVERVGLCY